MSLRNVASSGTSAGAAPAGNGVTPAPGQSPSHGGGAASHGNHRGVQRSISASSKQRRGSTGAEANSGIRISKIVIHLKWDLYLVSDNCAKNL